MLIGWPLVGEWCALVVMLVGSVVAQLWVGWSAGSWLAVSDWLVVGVGSLSIGWLVVWSALGGSDLAHCWDFFRG